MSYALRSANFQRAAQYLDTIRRAATEVGMESFIPELGALAEVTSGGFPNGKGAGGLSFGLFLINPTTLQQAAVYMEQGGQVGALTLFDQWNANRFDPYLSAKAAAMLLSALASFAAEQHGDVVWDHPERYMAQGWWRGASNITHPPELGRSETTWLNAVVDWRAFIESNRVPERDPGGLQVADQSSTSGGAAWMEQVGGTLPTEDDVTDTDANSEMMEGGSAQAPAQAGGSGMLIAAAIAAIVLLRR